MRNIFTIARREIFSFFVSPIAYILFAGYAVLAAYFFFNLLAVFNANVQQYQAMASFRGGMEEGGPNLNQYLIEPYYQTLLVILVFVIPLLTMRAFAEERSRGTFELLMTSPLSVGSIIVGKFLGVGFLLLVMNLLVFSFPALLLIFGDPPPEMWPVLSGLLAVNLCSFGFASVAMAVSAFTENQIVAGISGIVLLLLLYVIHAPANQIGGQAGKVLEYLSPVLQLQDMIRGVISTQSLIYFASLIVFGIFLSHRALEAQRWR